MKRWIFLMPMLLAAFVLSCSKPDELRGGGNEPESENAEYAQGFSDLDESSADAGGNVLLVSNVTLPRAFAPCLHSETLSIGMNGFKSGYSLIFKADDGDDLPAEAQSFSSGKLSFRLPEELVPGEYSLAVVSGETRQSLGYRYVMCDTPASAAGVNVSGTVRIGSNPAAKVVVSDGFAFTVSDSEGHYNLASQKANGYVFAQTPANALAAVDRCIPKFFQYLSSADLSVKETADFNFTPVDNTVHRFFLVTDLHISDYSNDDLVSCNNYFMPDLNESIDKTTVPAYILTAGDQTTEARWVSSGYDLTDWRDYVADWKLPIYHCMGNHDNDPQYVASDWNAESTWKKVIGPNWYSFDMGKVHYIVLDDIVYDNSSATRVRGYYVHFTDYQLEYLRKDLLKVDYSTPVIIVSHCPLYLANSVNTVYPHFDSYEDIADFVDCLKGFKDVHFLTGHTHFNQNVQVTENLFEHNMCASSASTWLCEWYTKTKLHYCRDGCIGGYQIWDIDGTDIKWQHKSIGRSVGDGQFHCVDLNQVPDYLRDDSEANAVLVNVYNWDWEWKVEVSEFGKPLDVQRIYRQDPVYKMIFPTQISSQTTPVNTGHIFRAVASSPYSTLQVKVTERFGNVYSKEFKRPYSLTIANYE